MASAPGTFSSRTANANLSMLVGCNDGDEVIEGSTETSFNLATFALVLRQRANRWGVTECARYVRIALCRAGLTAACGSGKNAGLWDGYLLGLGFTEVAHGITSKRYVDENLAGTEPHFVPTPPATSFTLQIGDIAVMQYGGNGHVCAWDGTDWISDFIQNANANATNPATGKANSLAGGIYGMNVRPAQSDQLFRIYRR
jgi:hypothetical protein